MTAYIKLDGTKSPWHCLHEGCNNGTDQGEWYCSKCVHSQLVELLEEGYKLMPRGTKKRAEWVTKVSEFVTWEKS